ncbi:SDR family oxidoreductase [Marinobacter guineae]|nr:SDR family oxidoreductase [Marinobacter guineae]
MSQTILITGASSGLGEGMAREFAAQGDNLALCARRTDRLEILKAELNRDYPKVTVSLRALDVNDHDQVFSVFRAFRDEFGSLDRVIVNAGIGKGQPLGTGKFGANRQTAETNFVAALAQMEAAMEIFREQNRGHLVTVSSVTAIRGLPGNVTTYAATKAGLASLSEGLRVELAKAKSPIKVTTLYPGYIRTEINEKVRNTPFIVDAETGCRAMVKAINSGKAECFVPAWPWTPIGFLLRRLPVSVLARIF